MYFCRFLSFGFGKRACIGEVFAKSRMFLFVATMMQICSVCKPSGELLSKFDPRMMVPGVVFQPPPYRVQFKLRESDLWSNMNQIWTVYTFTTYITNDRGIAAVQQRHVFCRCFGPVCTGVNFQKKKCISKPSFKDFGVKDDVFVNNENKNSLNFAYSLLAFYLVSRK
jgi:hypothetical protein